MANPEINQIEVDNVVYDIECMTDAELTALETALGITHGQASRLYNILNGIITPFGKTLWTGVWTSGEKTIPGASKYAVFIIVMNGAPMLAYYDNDSERVNGYSITGAVGSASQYDQRFRASVDGDKWTITYLEQTNHTANSPYHTLSSSAKTINVVIGLVPRWG